MGGNTRECGTLQLDGEFRRPDGLAPGTISPGYSRILGVDVGLPADVIGISAANYGGDWKVYLSSAVQPDLNFGEGWCPPGTERDEILGIVTGWFRDNDEVAFVPADATEVEIDPGLRPFMLAGLIAAQLVRS